MRTVTIKNANLDHNADIIDGLHWAREAWGKVQKAELDGIFNLEDVKRGLDASDVVADGAENKIINYLYIGKVWDFYPSGKYYMPWACRNVDPFEADCDEIYRDLAEIELAEIGAILASGEGDPTDLYIERWMELDEHRPDEYPTSEELIKLPTLCTGQADDLKLERDVFRYWVSRCEADPQGNPKVSIEARIRGRWATVAEYYTTDDIKTPDTIDVYEAI